MALREARMRAGLFHVGDDTSAVYDAPLRGL